MGLESRLPTATWGGAGPEDHTHPSGALPGAGGGLAAGDKDVGETQVAFKIPKFPSD